MTRVLTSCPWLPPPPSSLASLCPFPTPSWDRREAQWSRPRPRPHSNLPLRGTESPAARTSMGFSSVRPCNPERGDKVYHEPLILYGPRGMCRCGKTEVPRWPLPQVALAFGEDSRVTWGCLAPENEWGQDEMDHGLVLHCPPQPHEALGETGRCGCVCPQLTVASLTCGISAGHPRPFALTLSPLCP